MGSLFQESTEKNCLSHLYVEIVMANAASNEPQSVTEAVAFFAAIADAEGWQPDGELDAYRAASTFFVLWEAHPVLPQAVAGALQLAHLSGQALPSKNVWPELRPGASDAHVSILSLHPRWRGWNRGSGLWLLCAAMWRHCVESGIPTLWLEATPIMLRAYRLLGLPLQIEGDLRTHWGEPCYPCSLSVRDVAGTLAQRAVTSKRYRAIFLAALGSEEA